MVTAVAVSALLTACAGTPGPPSAGTDPATAPISGSIGGTPEPPHPPPTGSAAPGDSAATDADPASPGTAPPVPASAAPRVTDARVIAHGKAGRMRIALTFDSNMTPAMLHRLDTGAVPSYANDAVVTELQQRHAPATFFLSGLWVRRYPELTRRIAADPRFELASHSYAHRGFTAHCYTLDPMPVAEMAEDVTRSFGVLAPYGGHQTRFFRFPGGCYDDTALRAIAPAGATVIQYDIVGGDAFSTATPEAIAAGVLRQAHDGAIVVLHITKGNAPHTAQALPRIVDGLRADGYHLVTLSELLR